MLMLDAIVYPELKLIMEQGDFENNAYVPLY